MITQNQFTAFKADAIARQPLRKTILLSDLRFHTMDAVEYSGLMLGLSRPALKDIVRLVGFSVQGTNTLNSALGEEGSINILNSLKNVISSAKGQEVIMFVSHDRVITQITKSDKGQTPISTEAYFDFAERILDRHQLDIKSVSFNEKNGNISIESVMPGDRQFQVGGLSDEIFHTGLSMSKNSTGIQADPYMHRLVCTNGMVTRQFEESFKLTRNDPHMWTEFYKHLDNIERGGFVPVKFANKVNDAISTPASLYELEQGLNLVSGASNCKGDDLEMFFRGTKNTYNRLHTAGIDTVKLTDAQKRSVRTGLKVWDVINGVTDFASHNYGYEKTANADRHLQLRAGDLLSRDFDTKNIILNQPF
jgi:hypothetical protein